MKTRTAQENNRIAAELMSGCQSDEDWGEDDRTPWTDHQAIAAAIISNTPAVEILNMPEMDSWPDTYVWVRNELRCFDSEI